MTQNATESRPFEPGTTGWTSGDLDDPQIAAHWESGRYEIVEGVLTTMAPAYFLGGKVLYRLMYRVTTHVGEDAGSFAPEVEVVCAEDRVVRADAVFLTPAQQELQTDAARLVGRMDPVRTRILIPPKLIIESVSPGHELHDHRTKRRWYAEFGVENYWIVDSFKRSLLCLILRDGQFVEDVKGTGETVVQPVAFPRLTVSLEELWKA